MPPPSEELLNCWTDATTAAGTEGIQRKLQEMRYAIALEQKYSKNDILLGYLNIANFGGQTYGIDAAAKYYFGVRRQGPHACRRRRRSPASCRTRTRTGSTSRAARSTTHEGIGYNKAPDGLIDDVPAGQLAALDTLLGDGTITQEQYLAAADGYSATKGRQLYVLSRMLDDGKITQEQYVAAAIEPITPVITPATTGCAAAGGAAYFCQYVKNIIKTDPAFGATTGGPHPHSSARRSERLHDARLPHPEPGRRGRCASGRRRPSRGWSTANTGKFGSAAVSIEAATGRDPRDRAEHDVQRGRHARERPELLVARLRGRLHVRQLGRLPRRLDVQALHPHRLAREGPLGQRDAQRRRCA